MQRIIGGAALILLGLVVACGEEDDDKSSSASGGSSSSSGESSSSGGDSTSDASSGDSSSSGSNYVEEYCRIAMLAEDECSGVDDYQTVDECTADAQEEADAYPECDSEREALAACYADKGASDLECDESLWSVQPCAQLEDAEYECLG
jgi:hypothetical protein